MYFESLRDLLGHLEDNGKLHHVTHEVDKDWEIAAITRQVIRQPRHDPALYRGQQRRQAEGRSDDLERPHSASGYRPPAPETIVPMDPH